MILSDRSEPLDMFGDSNQTVGDVKDSFYDDQDDATPTLKPIQSIRIITSKPPVYRRDNNSSDSQSPSSIYSDHDVTDVSSIGGEQQQRYQQSSRDLDKTENRKQLKSSDHQFRFESMKTVLLGTSGPMSRPPSPAQPTSPTSSKKQVRIATEDTGKFDDDDQPPVRNHQMKQPYIHGHKREQPRVRLTSSAINRQKQQQKIERENLVSISRISETNSKIKSIHALNIRLFLSQKILERLQRTRASQGLKREELLSNYDRQISYVTYPATSPSAPIPAPRARSLNRPSSAIPDSGSFLISEKKSTQFNRPSSASNSVNSNSVRSRPVSAPISLHGSSRSSSSRRPIWNDRWQSNQE